jgi:hypothetical protein
MRPRFTSNPFRPGNVTSISLKWTAPTDNAKSPTPLSSWRSPVRAGRLTSPRESPIADGEKLLGRIDGPELSLACLSFPVGAGAWAIVSPWMMMIAKNVSIYSTFLIIFLIISDYLRLVYGFVFYFARAVVSKVGFTWHLLCFSILEPIGTYLENLDPKHHI